QDVVAGPAVEDILPRPADEEVVASIAAEGVIAGAADQDIIAVPAVLHQPDGGGGQPRGIHPVVASARIDDQAVDGRVGADGLHPGSQTQDVSVADDRNVIVAGSAVDDYGVRLAITRAGAGRGRAVD